MNLRADHKLTKIHGLLLVCSCWRIIFFKDKCRSSAKDFVLFSMRTLFFAKGALKYATEKIVQNIVADKKNLHTFIIPSNGFIVMLHSSHCYPPPSPRMHLKDNSTFLIHRGKNREKSKKKTIQIESHL